MSEAYCDGYGTMVCHCGGDMCLCGADGEQCIGCPKCEEREDLDYLDDDKWANDEQSGGLMRPNDRSADEV